ncbi:MAG: U3 snoRNP protein [Thelocarpon superellum]|nr:MAG: U3 snoRNP protein [Thelocarpon superellum]
MNLESLRRKRVKRLGIKASRHAGQRRIFFVLDRATRKFHGNVALWVQYLEYARQEDANKKLAQILTSVLRMHPTKPELWIYAARHAVEHDADMTAARSYMLRGLRFCKSSRSLWLEYAKLEMIYLAKIVARHQVLGLDKARPARTARESSLSPGEDLLALPDVTAEEVDQGLVSGGHPDHFPEAPALSGAIPLAVFDQAVTQFPADEALHQRFFELFAQFPAVPCFSTVMEHVVQSMIRTAPTAASTLTCLVQQPLLGVAETSADFPAAFGQCVDRLQPALNQAARKEDLVIHISEWLLALLQIEGMDHGVRQVLSSVLGTTIRDLQGTTPQDRGAEPPGVASLAERLKSAGRDTDAQRLLTWLGAGGLLGEP